MKTLTIILVILSIVACGKYRKYDHLEVIENTYSGTLTIAESAGDIDGDFIGVNDSGIYSFVWDNPSKGMVLNVTTSTGSGSVQFVLEDSRGNEVLNETMSAGGTKVYSEEGKKGKWKVSLVFSDFQGDGSFDLNPIQ